MNPIQQNLIDSYLRDELSEAELSSFESMMESDPSFREEVRFEQYVKEGIGEYRKAELKARLNAIDVAPGWMGAGEIGTGTLIKTIGGLVTAGIVATAGYFVFLSDSDELPAAESKTEIITDHIEEINPDIPEVVVPEVREELEEDTAPVAKAEALEKKSPKAVTENVSSVESESAIRVSNEVAKEDRLQEKEEFVPQVNVPGLNEVESEEAYTSVEVEMPEASSSDKVNVALDPLDVKTINRRSEVLKYKFFEGKLYLYGDFKQQPYEILEINGTDDRQIFVHFNSNYYEVNVTDKVEELPVITNDKLIRELEILRNNKAAE